MHRTKRRLNRVILELSVCMGSSCHLKGSYNIIQIFQRAIEETRLHDKIEFKATFCMREYQNRGVAVSLGDEHYDLQPSTARDFFVNTVIPLLK